MFSDTQEVDLGDAMAETIALHVNVIHNEELTGHLRDLGNRLVQHLPPTHLNFRFYLVDLPEVNAFSIAGGRVYVSRKLVAFSHNDDELAGVLAHELGHIVTHQTAIEITRAFREVLGVTQVGDRNDIFQKFHQYVESENRHRRHGRNDEEKEQIIADQVSIFTLARAGFAVQADADWWDRFNGLHGKTGGWLSDFFGTTTPEQHRLRDMIKNMSALPPGCDERPASLDESTFKTWQGSVVDYDEHRTESLPGLVSKYRFNERIRPDITNLRFSPDGKYLLAQDEGGIHIISHEPFAYLFYISAPDARAAHFSADSTAIVFLTSGFRVEVWSVKQQKRTSVHEITLREPCLQSELSPDGGTLACLNSAFALELVDVSTSTILVEKKQFYSPGLFELLILMLRSPGPTDDGNLGAVQENLRLVSMGFSPEGRYFLASHGVSHTEYNFASLGDPLGMGGSNYVLVPGTVLMFDLANRREMPVPKSIRNLVPVSFAFLGSDRIVGVNPEAPLKSHIVKFPSGDNLEEVAFTGTMTLRSAAHGDALLIGPLKDFPLGVMDLTTKSTKLAIKQPTADVYDGIFVTERLNGELSLNARDSGQRLAALKLPESSLGHLGAVAVSPDLNYLAVSAGSRAAIWDVAHGNRAFYTRRFDAAGFDGPVLYADFPKFQESQRETGRLQIDNREATGKEVKEEIARQHGLYLVVLKPHEKNGYWRSNADVQVEDIRTGQLLWSRYFQHELPSIAFAEQGGTVLLRWSVSEPGAQNELHHLPELKPHAEKEDDLCEVVDANTGATLASFIAKTNHGSLLFVSAIANRNWAVMAAIGDQIITYTLPDGKQEEHFFGSHPIISSSGLLAVNSENREITIYDLATSEMRQQYVFSEPIAFKSFSSDGKRLLVFTSDQTVYLIDTAFPRTVEPAVTSKSLE
ncbi:MAG TPA: M48 family metalloprotease [Terriglobales bacterium]|nr:M48 family metalloprotease [Terriglobales bacterium]